jgi:hypothetical protein
LSQNVGILFADEVTIPKDANVYYAMATSNKGEALDFVILKDPT